MQQVLRHDFLPAGALGLLAGAASIATFWSLPLGLWIWAAASLAVATAWLLKDPKRWPPVFLAGIIVLPPLPFPIGDSGVHPALFVAFIGLWAGALRFRDWRPRFSLLSFSFATLLIALALSVPMAVVFSGLEIAGASAARIGLLALSGYTFFYIAHGPGHAIPAKSLVRCVFRAGLISSAFAILDFNFQFTAPSRFAEQFVWLSDGVYRRAQGPFYESSTLATLCLVLIALTLSASFRRTGRSLGFGAWSVPVGLPLFLTVLVLTFSRTALASLIVLLTVLVTLGGTNRPSFRCLLRVAVSAVLSFAGAMAVSALIFPSYLLAYATKLQHSARFFFSEPNLVLSRRLESWDYLIAYLAENPERLFLGIGFKTLPYTEHLGSPVIADNMYLSLLIETGWLGLAAVLALSFSILLHGWRELSRVNSPIRQTCGAALMAFWAGFMLQMLSGDVLTYWRVLLAVFALLAVGERNEDTVSRSI